MAKLTIGGFVGQNRLTELFGYLRTYVIVSRLMSSFLFPYRLEISDFPVANSTLA